MLCKPAAKIPTDGDWLYEPKWDGFRCIVFKDGDSVELTSRNEKPFTRYFPELVEVLRTQLPHRCVVDGEIVVPSPADAGTGLDFDALQQRIHPAASRVRRLAAETPSAFIAFDLLALEDTDLMATPLRERRRLLEDVLAAATAPLYLTPATTDAAKAEDWFTRFEGAGLDGVIAKRLDGVYTPDERTLVKVKHLRSCDAVVAGFRIHKDGQGVGSFLLGLYDDEGILHHVGVASAFTAKQRREFLAELTPLTVDALAGHPWKEWADMVAQAAGTRMPGGFSRWNVNKDLSWTAVRIERVCEVTFSQLQGRRFRHGAHFLRWRTDRTTNSCRYDQLDVADALALETVFSEGA